MAEKHRKRSGQRDKDKVQGEGDYYAARRFREDSEAFAKNRSNIDKAARKAKAARDSGEREDLDRAEKTGKEKANEFDPQVKRD